MPEQTFLARLVVIRRYEQHSIDAHFFRGASCRDRSARGIRTGPRQDLATAFRHFNGEANDLLAFVVGQRRRFAGRAHRHEARNSIRDLVVDQLRKRRQIDFAVLKRRDECGIGSSKHSLGHQISIVPSKTKSAGPVSVTFLNRSPSLSKSTSNSFPPRTSTPIGPPTFSSAENISALATTPVPHASVSSSTPRS